MGYASPSYKEAPWCRGKSLVTVGLAEFLGTGGLLYILTLLIYGADPLVIPFCIGAGVIGLIAIFGEASGAHFNPSVTLTYFLCEPKFTLFRAIVYIFAECLGGICGAYLAAFSAGTPKNPYTVFGYTSGGMSVLQIGLAEMIWTAILCATAMRGGMVAKEPSPFTPIWIAGVIIAGSFAAGSVSGCCMNPAVGIAFAIRNGTWIDALMYTIAPSVGGVLAALLAMSLDPDLWNRRVGISSPSNVRASNFIAHSDLPPYHSNAPGNHTRIPPSQEVLKPDGYLLLSRKNSEDETLRNHVYEPPSAPTVHRRGDAASPQNWNVPQPSYDH